MNRSRERSRLDACGRRGRLATPPSPRTLLALVLLAALGAIACSEPRRPDVLLVTLDTLRPDHLGFLGHERETAPFLAAIAERSAVFPDMVSTSSATAPATASLFTGRYPSRHGVVEGFLAHRRHVEELARQGKSRIALPRIPESIATLPEILQAEGYATFGVAANINVGSEMGFDRGFERFEKISRPMRLPGVGSVPYATASQVLETLSKWQAELVDDARPVFLYLHFNDVHRPYVPRRDWLVGEGPAALYDSEIGYVDDALSEVISRYGFDRDSLIVVVSDHGEGFGEHGFDGHPPSLHAELNRALLLIDWPGGGVEPAQHAGRASLVDVVPTVLDLIGIDASKHRSEGDEAPGLSLAPLARGSLGAANVRSALAERTLFAERSDIVAAMRGRWKLIRGEGAPGRLLLYDTVDDPTEQHDRSQREADVTRELAAEIDAFAGARPATAGDATEVELDAGTLEQLESLGYVAP